MMRNIAVVALVAVTVSGCEEKKKLPADVKPVKQLDQEGKAPLAVLSSSKSIAPIPGGGVFNITVRNISDSKVSMFKSVSVLLGGNGNPLPGGEVESGWGELSGIEAGESVQLSVAVPGEASRMKVVFKEVYYDVPNPLGKDMPALTMKWANPRLNQELGAARAGN